MQFARTCLPFVPNLLLVYLRTLFGEIYMPIGRRLTESTIISSQCGGSDQKVKSFQHSLTDPFGTFADFPRTALLICFGVVFPPSLMAIGEKSES